MKVYQAKAKSKIKRAQSEGFAKSPEGFIPNLVGDSLSVRNFFKPLQCLFTKKQIQEHMAMKCGFKRQKPDEYLVVENQEEGDEQLVHEFLFSISEKEKLKPTTLDGEKRFGKMKQMDHFKRVFKLLDAYHATEKVEFGDEDESAIVDAMIRVENASRVFEHQDNLFYRQKAIMEDPLSFRGRNFTDKHREVAITTLANNAAWPLRREEALMFDELVEEEIAHIWRKAKVKCKDRKWLNAVEHFRTEEAMIHSEMESLATVEPKSEEDEMRMEQLSELEKALHNKFPEVDKVKLYNYCINHPEESGISPDARMLLENCVKRYFLSDGEKEKYVRMTSKPPKEWCRASDELEEAKLEVSKLKRYKELMCFDDKGEQLMENGKPVLKRVSLASEEFVLHEQMRILDALEHIVYNWFKRNLVIDLQDEEVSILLDLLRDVQKEHIGVVEKISAYGVPIWLPDAGKMKDADFKEIQKFWRNLSEGKTNLVYGKSISDKGESFANGFRMHVNAMHARLLTRPEGRKLLQNVAHGSFLERDFSSSKSKFQSVPNVVVLENGDSMPRVQGGEVPLLFLHPFFNDAEDFCFEERRHGFLYLDKSLCHILTPGFIHYASALEWAHRYQSTAKPLTKPHASLGEVYCFQDMDRYRQRSKARVSPALENRFFVLEWSRSLRKEHGLPEFQS
ncbi:hypothetical protein [Aureibacter tunicatorum]|uniref:Uncharacterized protein n=1 Tax=Aureibacter tunicatorum TaxID=866807 RepID=A0AAE4BUY9_9BACT|nr:hypothetical protein [Aureibacter tunicatorum]MDR6241317.1 hypothetical protein [Aureibacter tunicatorum]BDD03576.1 hypothetical protein AUTU_10590 [Aureibacter tunicatorum]